ncbi:hypothetical protein TNCV_3825491 [Trichonephila clavipes]|nr:hypothetical protein TNCV_3825491 [Trichonephila clavipes]
MELCPPDSHTTCEKEMCSIELHATRSDRSALARARVLRKRAHLKGFPEFLCFPACEECPRSACLPFFPEKDEEDVSSVSTCNVKCCILLMTFLLRLTKCDLLEVARELGVEVNGDQLKVEIKDMILQNDKNDMETIKAVTEGILEEKEREFELEKLRIRLRNKLNENKLKAGNRINDLANVCILSENRTTEVSEPVNKCRPLINPVINKSVEIAASCDFEKENCDPQ